MSRLGASEQAGFVTPKPSRKPGRPPIGKRAMNDADRQKRFRKKRAKEKARAEKIDKHAAKKARRDAREVELAETTIAAGKALGTEVYGVLYGDPPWRTEVRSRETGLDRAADNHYPTMTLDEIKALRLPAAPDCVLFLWVTVPMKALAQQVLDAWGFTYKSTRYWVKPYPGTGHWERNEVEELWIATRGRPPAPAPGTQPPQVVYAPRGRHSEKPEIFADDIERHPNVPKLEMFARRPRDGWDCWGNEVVDMAEAAA